MAALLVQQQVKDYAKWKKVFDSVQELRTESGEIGHQIYRDAANPNKLTVVLAWDSVENAQKYAQLPELRASMEEAGVEGKPNISFVNKA